MILGLLDLEAGRHSCGRGFEGEVRANVEAHDDDGEDGRAHEEQGELAAEKLTPAVAAVSEN